MDNQSGHVMTLANSIIGVSVLAMPYCFKQCGIVLSVLMLLISSIISRLACHFLLKSAIIARRKTFEYLAFHIFGGMGKFAIEIGIIGFLIGTCIAFFVVMGDLAPEIIAEISGIYTTNTMRTSILMALALFCVLPLGLLRNVDSLNGVSKATIGFYCCLVSKIVFEAIPHIFSGDWYDDVVFWRPAGIMQCLPIFSMALFCQTQLFEIYQALPNATLEKMNNLVRVAVNICTWVYIFVGVFGYIAFSKKPFTGNILMSFSPSLMTDVMKIGFVLSVAFSFPLIIFPCRASMYSLLYKEGYSIHEGMSNYIPEGKFKGLTMLIVFISLIIGIMIPSIELVLGLVGSTIGVMICVLFPVTCFICISPRNTNERILAQIMLMVGVCVMVLGTYKNLYTLDNLEPNTVTISSLNNLDQVNLNVAKAVDEMEVKNIVEEKIPSTVKFAKILGNAADNVKIDQTTLKVVESDQIKEVRHEPPQPIEEEDNEVKKVEENEIKKVESKEYVAPEVHKSDDVPIEPDKVEVKKLGKTTTKGPKLEPVKKYANESKSEKKDEEVDIEAIKKQDKEEELQAKEKIKEGDTHQVLIDTIQKQNEVQKDLVEQQKKLIEVLQSQQKNVEGNDIDKVKEEKLKAVKQIESIAREAIEKISGGKDDEKLIADLEKDIKKNVEQDIKEKQESNKKKEILTAGNGAENEIKNSGGNKEQNVELIAEGKQEVPLRERELPKVTKLDTGSKGNIEQNVNKQDHQDNLINTDNMNKVNMKVEVPKIVDINKSNQETKIENKIEEKGVIIENNSEQNKNKENAESKNIENIQSPKEKETPESNKQENTNKHLNIPQPSIDNNRNINNTAPLFLRLGKAEVNSEVKKMVPLPLAVSNFNSNNLSKIESLPEALKNDVLPQEKKIEPVVDAELQAIRRDILSLTSKK